MEKQEGKIVNMKAEVETGFDEAQIEQMEMETEGRTLTPEEFEELKEMNQSFMNLTMDIGNNQIQKIALEQRRAQLEVVFESTQKKSDEVMLTLREKYGDINININTGDFVKAPSGN